MSALTRATRALAALACALTLAGTALAEANEAKPAAADPVLEARLQKIAVELRCLVCQNQTIADSNADLAVDLRRQVREMLRAGKSEKEIIDYMTARYGDFVLYRPPVRNDTALLWFGPAALMMVGVIILGVVLRRRAKLKPEQFEPDPSDEDELAARR